MIHPSRPVLIKACLNGNTSANAHSAVPLSPEELARDARLAVEAGAAALHVHARLADGSETLAPGPCIATIRAIRSACPGVPVGLTTSASAEADPDKRLALVREWSVKPDFVSVNMHESGSLDLCNLLIEVGIAIEAGLWTVHAAETFLHSGLARHCVRVLVEVQDQNPPRAVASAHAIDQKLIEGGVLLPQVHHGEGLATWSVIEAAFDAGHDVRIGLEDTIQRPDGGPTSGNAELVALAVEMARRHGRRPLLAHDVPDRVE